MKKKKEDNIVKFPSSLSSGEREVEAILFAAAEPLEIESIEVESGKRINSVFHKLCKKQILEMDLIQFRN